jgi:hypothetical protein
MIPWVLVSSECSFPRLGMIDDRGWVIEFCKLSWTELFIRIVND